MDNVITCFDCGDVILTKEQYDWQMNRPHRGWICPQCGSDARWKGQFERCEVPECAGWVQVDGDGMCNTCGTDAYEWYMDNRMEGDDDGEA